MLQIMVATCVGLATAGFLQLASVPLILAMPLLFLVTLIQDVGLVDAFPLDFRRVIPWIQYFWYGLFVSLALVLMDGGRKVDPTGVAWSSLRGKNLWRHASWSFKLPTMLTLVAIAACLAWPLWDGYRFACFSRAGAQVAYEFKGESHSRGRTIAIDFGGADINDQVLLSLRSDFAGCEPFHLDLSWTGVTDQSVELFDGNQNLLSLGLNETAVSDVAVARLADCGSLEKLSLNGTRITDEAIHSMTAMANLRDLHLFGTQVSADGIVRLQAAKRLKNLTLGTAMISDSAIDQLQKTRPGLQIHRVAAIEPRELPPRQKPHGIQYWFIMSIALLLVLLLGLGPFYMAYRSMASTAR